MRRGNIKTLFGFFLLPLISMLAAFIAIPVLVRVGGADGWTAVAVAQGVGVTAAIVVTFGWGTVGPAAVARAEPTAQHHLYFLSVIMRAILFVICAPAAVAISLWLVDPRYALLAAVVAVASTAQGFAPGWFLIGQGRPLAIAAMETGPRAAAQLLSVLVVALTHDLFWYAAILLIGEAFITANGIRALARREHREASVASEVWRDIKQQWPLAAAGLAGAGYTRAAVPIVSAVAYPAAATYAALDRVQQLSRNGIRPLVSFFQGWVARHHPEQSPARRSALATLTTLGIGFVVALAVAVLLPTFDYVLFEDKINVTPAQSILLGVTILFVSGSFSTGLYYLAPQGKVRILSVSSVIGSAAGIPLLAVLSPMFGATGAMGAIAIAEGLVVAWQALYIVATRPRQ